MERQINEFNFTIGGEIEQIDAKTLAQTLICLDDILVQINSDLKTDKKIELTVKTYKPGSFDIYLQLLSDATTLGAASGLFNSASLESAKQIIDYLTAILNVKKFFRGEEPKEVTVIGDDNVQITNNAGTVVVIKDIIFNLSKNTDIDEAITKLASVVKGIPYTTGLSISDNHRQELFKADKKANDLNILIQPTPLKTLAKIEKTKDVPLTNVVLTIKKVLFNAIGPWQFIYESRPISAYMKDGDFKQKVDDRQQQFASGDRMFCDMIIHQKYDETLQVYVDKTFTIVKVYSVQPPEVQLGI